MLAVLLVISILSGAMAVGVGHMLAFPLWSLIALYPICGTVGLLAAATISNREILRLPPSGGFSDVQGAALSRQRVG